jgi:hypothetical protein
LKRKSFLNLTGFGNLSGLKRLKRKAGTWKPKNLEPFAPKNLKSETFELETK